jgi:DNA-binding response OmpR family regulator
VPKILLVGHDVHLLFTRAAVLKKAGADVSSCEGSQAVGLAVTEKPDLVVLCHSLLKVDAESIADEIRRCCETTKVLAVLSEVGSESPLHGAKFDAVCVSNPYRLTATVGALLGGKLHPQTQTMKSAGSGAVTPGSRGDYQM